MSALESLFERFRQRDRVALARLLTLASRGEQVEAIRAALKALTPHPALTRREGEKTKEEGEAASPSLPSWERGPGGEGARVVAFTGSAGVGKSTLIGKLTELLRGQGHSVAVLACDPQSPLTGGALLGDRLRMPNWPDDPGVFIRSLAVASGQEGIAEHLDVMVDLLKQFGFDFVLLETVGAGQGDTAVRNLADLVVLLLQPETGDDIQWQKAGLLEIADVVVVHKADLPEADQVEAQVRELLNLPGCREVPVLQISAQKGQGLEELYQLIRQRPSHRLASPPNGRLLLRLAQQRLAERFREQPNRVRPILERWERRELNDVQAAEELLRVLSGR